MLPQFLGKYRQEIKVPGYPRGVGACGLSCHAMVPKLADIYKLNEKSVPH